MPVPWINDQQLSPSITFNQFWHQIEYFSKFRKVNSEPNSMPEIDCWTSNIVSGRLRSESCEVRLMICVVAYDVSVQYEDRSNSQCKTWHTRITKQYNEEFNHTAVPSVKIGSSGLNIKNWKCTGVIVIVWLYIKGTPGPFIPPSWAHRVCVCVCGSSGVPVQYSSIIQCCLHPRGLSGNLLHRLPSSGNFLNPTFLLRHRSVSKNIFNVGQVQEYPQLK